MSIFSLFSPKAQAPKVTVAHGSGRKARVSKAAYVPFGRALNHPKADVQGEIEAALEQILSQCKFDAPVALNVSGNMSMIRVIKLPPVEAKKVDDIVTFEARQNIPFKLLDVAWGACLLEGASESGFLLDSQVVLVARKGDVLQRELRQLSSATQARRMKVDSVQVSPLSLANYLIGTDIVSGYSQHSYVLALDMGVETTTLVITDGFNVWFRDLPIGGGHFTTRLVRERGLTLEKAEKLKLELSALSDVLPSEWEGLQGDFVEEIARSLKYFGHVDREARLTGIALFGGGLQMSRLRSAVLDSVGIPEVAAQPDEVMHGLFDSRVKDHWCSLHGPIGAAMERLSIGKFFVNLLPNGMPAEPKTNCAWGLEIGQCGLKAVKIEC